MTTYFLHKLRVGFFQEKKRHGKRKCYREELFVLNLRDLVLENMEKASVWVSVWCVCVCVCVGVGGVCMVCVVCVCVWVVCVWCVVCVCVVCVCVCECGWCFF